jgi:type II secretory pathway component PulC
MQLMVDQRKIKLYLLCGLCAVLGFFLARIGFDYLAERQKKELPAIKTRPPAVVMPVAPSPVVLPAKAVPVEVKKVRPELTLNGVVVSPGQSYALINNKIIEQGETIEGLKVIRISNDNVELQDGDTTFKLSSKPKSF